MLVLRRALLALATLLLVLVAGCDEPSRAGAIRVILSDATGASPALGCGPGTLEAVVDQGFGQHRFEVDDVPVSADGTFDLPLEIATYTAITRIQVGFDLETCDRLLGTVPPFWLAGVGVAVVVTGERLTCADLEAPSLTTGRTGPALVSMGVNLFVVGGTTRGTSTDRLIPVFGPWLTLDDAIPAGDDNPFPTLTRPLQQTRAARLGVSRLVIASGDRTFRFDTDLEDGDGEQAIAGVHEGAGGRSALVDLGNEGVAIVGGAESTAEDAEGVASISWIDASTGGVRVTALATPRRDPAAVWVGGGLLIAGGQAEGQPLLEFAPNRGDGAALEGSPTEARAGAVLVAPERRLAMLLGGLAADGTVRADTSIVSGCPACRLSEGAVWETPRLRPALAHTATATWLVGGESAEGVASADVDVVRVVGDVVSVQALTEGRLPTPRRAAGAAELADGVVAVFGGVDDEGAELGSMALCWPSQLDELE